MIIIFVLIILSVNYSPSDINSHILHNTLLTKEYPRWLVAVNNHHHYLIFLAEQIGFRILLVRIALPVRRVG